jgi:hypothetical protein
VGSILPIAGVVQWASGLILAIAVARRARAFGRDGRVPHLLAKLALWLFVITALELIVSLTPLRGVFASLVSPEYFSGPWQLRTLLLLSLGAWLLLGIAAAWNGTLSVASRRRAATAELRRRTERALRHMDHHASADQSD